MYVNNCLIFVYLFKLGIWVAFIQIIWFIFLYQKLFVETYEMKFIIKISLAMKNIYFSMFHSFDWILSFFAVN